jgi:hypothetical protein
MATGFDRTRIRRLDGATVARIIWNPQPYQPLDDRR